jgi:RNA polymerase sigma-70 factor (ECF subfamily)
MSGISVSEMPSATFLLSGQPQPCRVTNRSPAEENQVDVPGAPRTFDSIYHTHASFVWRSTCRLGVPYSAAEDVMQEVFLVVHRRLPEFEERTSVKAWLSAIVIRVVRAYRRKVRRKDPAQEIGAARVDPDSIADEKTQTPYDAVERDEAVQELYEVLSQMNDERREVFVLSELEELTAPEIAHALQANLNTIYWRLRTARKEFERILFKRQALAIRSHR